jgi:hypothetical protein
MYDIHAHVFPGYAAGSEPNPKSEYRNPKQIPNPKFKTRKPVALVSDFEFVSDFDIRISLGHRLLHDPIHDGASAAFHGAAEAVFQVRVALQDRDVAAGGQPIVGMVADLGQGVAPIQVDISQRIGPSFSELAANAQGRLAGGRN